VCLSAFQPFSLSAFSARLPPPATSSLQPASKALIAVRVLPGTYKQQLMGVR
jgi:hypothetical protein